MSNVVGSREIGNDFENILLVWTVNYGNVGEWRVKFGSLQVEHSWFFTFLFKALFTPRTPGRALVGY